MQRRAAARPRTDRAPPAGGTPLTHDDPHEYDDEQEERSSPRRERRKPRGRLRAAELADGGVPEIAWLIERGYLDTVEGELKSGKEATVYTGTGPTGLCAIKVFRDRAARSFKSDARYATGRFVGDTRTEKAIAKRSAFGRKAQAALWAAHEYRMLWRLRRAGVSVPRPLVGPAASEIARSGEVVLMAFVGDEDGAAPRLSDLSLDGEEAAEAFRQSVHVLGAIWRAGVVHADYSAFNLLWWRGEVVVIDLPQAVTSRHREAKELLERDARSLCGSFAVHGIEADPDEVLASVRAGRPDTDD